MSVLRSELNRTFHNYDTRDINDIHIFRVNSRLNQKCIKFKAATLWNKLPVKIKQTKIYKYF